MGDVPGQSRSRDIQGATSIEPQRLQIIDLDYYLLDLLVLAILIAESSQYIAIREVLLEEACLTLAFAKSSQALMISR